MKTISLLTTMIGLALFTTAQAAPAPGTVPTQPSSGVSAPGNNSQNQTIPSQNNNEMNRSTPPLTTNAVTTNNINSGNTNLSGNNVSSNRVTGGLNNGVTANPGNPYSTYTNPYANYTNPYSTYTNPYWSESPTNSMTTNAGNSYYGNNNVANQNNLTNMGSNRMTNGTANVTTNVHHWWKWW